MDRLSITIATGDYDRVRPVIDGRVGVEGCAVNYMPVTIEEASYRAFTNHEFDVAEVSLSSYIIGRSRGELPYIAIPVFTSRMFRHSAIYVRADAGIERPEDLKGRAVGVPVYAMTAALWVRGMLKDDYAVQPSDIVWRTGGLEQPGRYGRFTLDLPPEIRVEPIASDETLSGMLDSGALPALVTARAPSCFRPGGEVTRLFEDGQAAEADYYRRTGFFPIMHVLVVRESLAKTHPWLPASLYKAFLAAKNLCLAELYDTTALKVSSPWLISGIEAARELMGEDIWPYGFDDNRAALEAMTRWSVEQGMAVRKMDPAELFHPTTRERARV